MRTQAILITTSLLSAALFGAEGRLSPRFRTVYILGMASGRDQYLANRLTSARVMWVVLEPTSADAVLTETLDDTFWTWLTHTYPPPASASRPPGNEGVGALRGSQLNQTQGGTVFLVDPRSKVILWSTYEPAKNSSPGELDHAAERIGNQLKASLSRKYERSCVQIRRHRFPAPVNAQNMTKRFWPGQRPSAFAVASGNLLDDDGAAAAAIDASHGVQQEDEESPQQDELEAPLGKLIVAGRGLLAA
jgi:hypothetical protein